MRAIGFNRYGDPSVIEVIDVPKPKPKSDEILVKVGGAGVNPFDAALRKGEFPYRFLPFGRPPVLLGSEFAGVVDAVGAAVSEFKMGDIVYSTSPTQGGCADYVAVKTSYAALAPKNLSVGDAALIPMAATTALHGLRNHAKLKPGARILINGASGGVGTYAVQIAKVMGASHVTAVCSGANADLVRSIGADAVIDYKTQDVFAIEDRFDVIFTAIWNHSYADWRKLAAKRGTIVSVDPWAGMNPIAKIMRKLRGLPALKSFFVLPSSSDLEILRVWIEAEQVKPIVDRVYPPDQARTAHEHSASGRARGKLGLIFDEQLAALTPEKLSKSAT